MELNIDARCRYAYFYGYGLVFSRRLDVAGWVVMRHDEGAGLKMDQPLNDLARIYITRRDTSGKKALDPKNLVLGIEENEIHLFDIILFGK